MYAYSTEVGTIKPLIICGGCSFTHSPDSWAQVLGNHRPPNSWTQDFFEAWRDFGIEQAGASPDIFPDSIYEYWDEGEDMTPYIDVLVVGQGAAGNDLNSRVIRNVIHAEREKNPHRPIGVFWQLSGWDRIEMLSNQWSTTWHADLYKQDEHMTSVIRPWSHVPSEMKQISGHVPYDNATTEEYLPKNRYWWKSGGAGHEQWLDSPLEQFTKEYYESVWTEEYTAVKNLEYIEHTRMFCDNYNIPITIFPGWSHTWDKAINVGGLQSTVSAFEILGRLPEDIVTDIPGFHGIAEWATQYEIYRTTSYIDNYADVYKDHVNVKADLGSSAYEKYKHDNSSTWDVGNHPSVQAHALFSHNWIKPRVKEMISKF